MRKRKSPILLVSVIVVLVLAVGFWNLLQSGVFQQLAAERASRQAANQAPTDAEKNADAEEMKDALDEVTKSGPPKNAPGPPMPGESMDDGPTVALPKAPEPTKAMPSDSETASMWWREESGRDEALKGKN